jgi:hypothetical protein
MGWEKEMYVWMAKPRAAPAGSGFVLGWYRLRLQRINGSHIACVVFCSFPLGPPAGAHPAAQTARDRRSDAPCPRSGGGAPGAGSIDMPAALRAFGNCARGCGGDRCFEVFVNGAVPHQRILLVPSRGVRIPLRRLRGTHAEGRALPKAERRARSDAPYPRSGGGGGRPGRFHEEFSGHRAHPEAGPASVSIPMFDLAGRRVANWETE